MPDPAEALLQIKDLSTSFRTAEGEAMAVDGLSLRLKAGETLAMVGESGSGKSVSALSLMGLLPAAAKVVKGAAWYGGRNLFELRDNELQKLRGAEISMIFQEPLTSLNPVLSIGRQITETLIEHRGMDQRAARARAIDMLRLVQIPEPEKRLRQYPHQFSGGMLQRVMIAIALACNPKILIADEPTTALDVTIQAQILALMMELRERFGAAVLLITHDLGVVAETADRVAVMYAGRKVEEATVYDLFERPRHPYTRGLLGALPRLGARQGADRPARLREIPGVVPALTRLPPGCRFAARCAHATALCRERQPPLLEQAPDHWAACWHSQAEQRVDG
ncbi:MAG: ABC transporter ATP-binding protein [Gammaproteobacteria bacterium]